MYFFLDRKNRFFQVGLFRINTPEQALSQFISPNFFRGDFGRYRKSLIVFQCNDLTRSAPQWALRCNYSSGFLFEFLRTNASKKKDEPQSHILWNLDTHQFVGQLPFSLNDSISISAHNGCVRIDSEQEQLLFCENQSVRIQGTSFVVQRTPLQPLALKISSTVAACFCLMVIAIFSLISRDSFAYLIKKSNKNSVVQELPDNPPPALLPTVTSLPQTQFAAEKPAQLSSQNEIFSRPIIQSKIQRTARSSGASGTPVDPLRCRPIEKKHKSSLLERFSEHSTQNSQGNWYVCR